MSYTTAIYIRISSEENIKNTNKTESSSITNQRKLIHEYIRNKKEFKDINILEFCDDGYSGKNFERPQITELLDMVKQGLINCIIVKDLSRFGRDMIEVGNYLEYVFPLLNIRFISINDSYDSINKEHVGSLDSGFKTLIYDLYSRDLSTKIKKTQRMKAEKGEYKTPYAPYGYIFNKEVNIFIIDEESSKIVNRIFNYIAEGKKTGKIAKILNDEGQLTPMQMKRKNGVKRKWNTTNTGSKWTSTKVYNIATNQVYTGARIYGKLKKVEIGSKKNKTRPKEEVIVIENRHQAIVSKELYETVQSKIRRKKKTKKPETITFLSGKIICECCGCKMKNIRNKYYTCKMTTDKGCHKGQIYVDALKTAIQEIIIKQAQCIIDIEKNIQKELDHVTAQLDKVKDKSNKLYEQYILESISKEEYMLDASEIKELKQELSEQINSLEDKLSLGDNKTIEERDTYKELLTKEQITDEIINELVSTVIVDTEGKIKIKLNFNGIEYKQQ
ncbi:recombinase family protein [Clostridiaceae bacterium M8S5]|nr:recombinase family protein [Clostridiaceae bacterium M8S5]